MDEQIKNWLVKNKIEYELFKHPPVYTVDEASKFYDNIPGLHCKNLFLKDSKKKEFYLVSLTHDRTIKLNLLRKLIGAKKLRFASPDELFICLKLEPGSVSPFGLINYKQEEKITLILDEHIYNADLVCFHPNINTETMAIRKSFFQIAIKSFDVEFKVIKINNQVI